MKKYQEVYQTVVKTGDETKKVQKRKSVPKPVKKELPVSSSAPKKPLNSYQAFVREESKKEKYAKLRGSQRLSKIAESWEKEKRKNKLKTKTEKIKNK